MPEFEHSQALYRKWRPQNWDAVVGQGHIIKTLRQALAAGKSGHAYLFAGPRGTGKTTTARLLAKAVNCLSDDPATHPCGECEPCKAVAAGRFIDLIEIDAASNTSVEDVRDLRDKINYSPNQGKYKVYIIDEVHMLSTAAFNALLKTLEEPPKHAIFILATTEVAKIPATVASRCQRFEFRRIPVKEITAHLRSLAEQEGIQVTPEALNLIANQSTGAMRDAISLLDQLASGGQEITLEAAQQVLGTAASQSVLDLIQALADREPAAGLDVIHTTLDAGSDPRQFARQIVDYLRDLILIHSGSSSRIDAPRETREVMGKHAQALPVPELLNLIRIFNTAAVEARGQWLPSLPLEMAFVSALNPQAQGDLSDDSDDRLPGPPAGSGRSTERSARGSGRGPVSAGGRSVVSSGLAVLRERSTGDEAAVESAGVPNNPTGPDDAASRPVVAEDPQAGHNLAAAWPQILDIVHRQNNSLYGALNSCKGKAMRGNKLVLSFASDVIKGKVEKTEGMDVLRQVLQQVFGFDVVVVCVIDANRRDSVPPGVDDDGMVAAALRDLGGELVDFS